MADFNINQITGKQGQQGTVLAGITTVSSTGAMRIPSGPTEQRGGRGRGVFAGGVDPNYNATMDYIEIATTGNASDWGDLTVAAQPRDTGSTSSTRGVFPLGNSDTEINTINYVTISSGGGAQDFGDMTAPLSYFGGASNNTRGFIFGGYDAPSAAINDIQYFTIATLGDAKDFGDMLAAKFSAGACSSSTRGVYQCGGPANNNVMQYITMASTGNATDFGDATGAYAEVGGTSNNTRGVFGGPNVPGTSPYRFNIIDYITIASAGNAADFGDLTVARTGAAAMGDAHGGIGG